MIGTHVFKITAQPAPENSSLLIIDVHHKWGEGKDAQTKQTSWMVGEVGDEMFLEAVIEALRASCSNNPVASVGSGK